MTVLNIEKEIGGGGGVSLLWILGRCVVGNGEMVEDHIEWQGLAVAMLNLQDVPPCQSISEAHMAYVCVVDVCTEFHEIYIISSDYYCWWNMEER